MNEWCNFCGLWISKWTSNRSPENGILPSTPLSSFLYGLRSFSKHCYPQNTASPVYSYKTRSFLHLHFLSQSLLHCQQTIKNTAWYGVLDKRIDLDPINPIMRDRNELPPQLRNGIHILDSVKGQQSTWCNDWIHCPMSENNIFEPKTSQLEY